MPPVGRNFVSQHYVLGLEDVRRQMQDLPKKVGETIVRRALYAGAVVIRDEARRRAPVRKGPGGGTLKKSLVAESDRRGPERDTIVARAIVGKGKTGKRSARAYAHFPEFGTAPHAVGRGSLLKARGRQKANQHGREHPGARARPYLGPAFEAKKFEALRVVTDQIRSGIAEAVAQGGKLASRRRGAA